MPDPSDPIALLFYFLPWRVAVEILAGCGFCAFLDAILPQPRAGSWWTIPRRALSIVGFNFLNAVNRLRPGDFEPPERPRAPPEKAP